jgi:hypothetical protein
MGKLDYSLAIENSHRTNVRILPDPRNLSSCPLMMLNGFVACGFALVTFSAIFSARYQL